MANAIVCTPNGLKIASTVSARSEKPRVKDAGAKEHIQIQLTRDPVKGFGFNIIGGSDKQHMAGRSDIFVTRVRAGTMAEFDGRLKPGDIILSINGIDLSGVTHEEALNIFKNAGDTCNLVVEQGGEGRILSEPFNSLDADRDVTFLGKDQADSTMDKNGSTHDTYEVTGADSTIKLFSDDEKYFTPVNSPSTAFFATRHQLLRESPNKLSQSRKSRSPTLKLKPRAAQNLQVSFTPIDDDESESVASLSNNGESKFGDIKGIERSTKSKLKKRDTDVDDEEERLSKASTVSSASTSANRVTKYVKEPMYLMKDKIFIAEVFFGSVGVVVLGGLGFCAYRWWCKDH